MVQVTGNFLNDRGLKNVPYFAAGVGAIQMTVDPFTDSSGNREPEAFDSAALLTIAVGMRTFLSENWGLRYETRYFHHDVFEEGQDEYVVDVGLTFVLGGQ